MGNPNAKPPEGGGFKPGQDDRRNAGGRTPTKWLRDLLSAACDKSKEGRARREELFFDTYWRARRRNPDTGAIDEGIPVKDANRAAEVLMAYDMGKPVEAVEVTSPDGSMSPTRADGLAAHLRSIIQARKADAEAEAKAGSTDADPSGAG